MSHLLCNLHNLAWIFYSWSQCSNNLCTSFPSKSSVSILIALLFHRTTCSIPFSSVYVYPHSLLSYENHLCCSGLTYSPLDLVLVKITLLKYFTHFEAGLKYCLPPFCIFFISETVAFPWLIQMFLLSHQKHNVLTIPNAVWSGREYFSI